MNRGTTEGEKALAAATGAGAYTVADAKTLDYEISDVILTVKYLEIPPETMDILAPGGQVSLNTEMYNTINTQDVAQTSSSTIIIPARYRSLKTIVTVMRNPVTKNKINNTFDYTSNNIKDWQYALGSELYPLTACKGLASSYRQLLSAYDMDDYDAENQVFRESWARRGDGVCGLEINANSVEEAVPQGRFVMAVSMEKFRAKSGLMFNGTSSIAENVMLHLNFEGQSLGNTSFSHIVHYDSIVTIAGGEASLSF